MQASSPSDPNRYAYAEQPDVDERVLDRVRKLLARAEHPTTPPAEAEACSEKAAALMARYLIDTAMLDATTSTVSMPVSREITLVPPYSLPKAVLLSSVARAFHVLSAIGDDRGQGRRCTLVGFPADLEMTELLFTSLLLQATTAMRAAKLSSRAFRRGFLLGYANTIGERLRKVSDDAVSERGTSAPGVAVVLASREARVEAAFAELFPHTRRLRLSASSGAGLYAGRQAGLAADLSTPNRRVGGGRRALAS